MLLSWHAGRTGTRKGLETHRARDTATWLKTDVGQIGCLVSPTASVCYFPSYFYVGSYEKRICLLGALVFLRRVLRGEPTTTTVLPAIASDARPCWSCHLSWPKPWMRLRLPQITAPKHPGRSVHPRLEAWTADLK